MFKGKIAPTPILFIFLLAFIFLLSANIFIGSVKSAPYQKDCEKRYIRPVTVNYYEEYICENGERVGKGDLMYSYYGEDSNCWNTDSIHEREQCQEEYPYGEAGTFRIGGNYIMSGSGAVKFEGNDGSGLHWIMTTTTEPMGNALGFKAESNDVIFGDNVIVGGDLNFDNADKEIEIAQRNELAFHIDAGKESRFLPGSGSQDINVLNFNNVFKIFEDVFCGINGSCEEDAAGDNYAYEADDIDFESIMKFKDAGYLCKDRLFWQESEGCNSYEYRAENVWSFYNKYNNSDEEVVGYDCKSNNQNCHSQPYVQYKLMDYTAESDTPGTTSGVEGVVRCMKEDCTDCEGGVYVAKPERRDNISCKECGDSINSRPFGCN
jgi:hypothetical protein